MNNPIPNDFLCPINLSIMKDPVICTDGHTYERAAIEKWLASNNTSPKTGMQLSSKTLIPNIALRNAIEEYMNKDVVPMETKEIPKEDVLSTIKRNPAHIICVVDVSGSMGTLTLLGETDNGFSRLDLVKHSLRTIMASLSEQDLLTIIPFSTEARVALRCAKMTPLSKVLGEEIIASLQPTDYTNIWDGLSKALEIGASTYENMNTSINLLTDGVPSGSLNTPDILRHFSAYPLSTKIPITTIGYDYELDINLLTTIATISRGRYMYVPDVSMIGTVFTHYLANTLSFEKYDPHTNTPRQLGVDFFQGTNSTVKLYFLLKDIIKLCTNKEYDKAQKLVKQYFDNPYTDEDVRQDLLSDDPNMGQIGLAVSEKHFEKWGQFYLPMLVFAHGNNECCNFKDRSVQRYRGPVFVALRNAIDHIFSTLPAPQPSKANTKSVRIATMASLHSSANICFDGSGYVSTKENSSIKVEELSPNDYILTSSGKYEKIRYIIEQKVKDVEVCRLNDFLITPWHPVKINDKWIFPNNLGTKELYTGTLYNLVLKEGHDILINNVPVITLGHNISLTESEVAYHPYFGSQIINDFEKIKPFGRIDLTYYKYVRDPSTKLVCGMVKN